MKTTIVTLLFLMNVLFYSSLCLANQAVPIQQLEITFRSVGNYQAIPWGIVEKSLAAVGKHDEVIQLNIKFEFDQDTIATAPTMTSFAIRVKDKKSEILKGLKKAAKQKFMDF